MKESATGGDLERFTLSGLDRELLPSEEDIRFYQEHGWYISKTLLSNEELDDMVTASKRYWTGHRDRILVNKPPSIEYWTPSDGDIARGNDYIFYEDETFRRVLSKPIIGAIAARLASTDQIRLLHSTLRYKPPGSNDPTSIVAWHFDRRYWQTHTSDELLTAFIPLHDCDEQMGTITMVDRSNKWDEFAGFTSTRHLPFYLRNHTEMERFLEENANANGAELRKVPMRLQKGQMSFHHCRTYHGSGPNLSQSPRIAVSFHLQDRANRWRQHHLPTGELLVYKLDHLVQKTPNGGYPDYSDPLFCPVLWEAGDRGTGC